MREYRFQATDETVELLRRLRGPWRGFIALELSFTIILADGSAVRLQSEGADIEDAFEAFRIEAIRDPEPDAEFEEAGDFAAGSNDIVLFAGAAWSEGGVQPTEQSLVDGELPPNSSMHFSGHPGQLSETADIVCLTTDAVVIAATTGHGILVRTGLKPYSLDVVRDAGAIATFLRERGYESE